MKRISRSLLSLCLALVLCAALLPVNVAKATGKGTTAAGGNQLSDHRLPGQQKQHLHRRYGGYHGLLIPHGRQQRFDPRRARP